MSDHHRAGTDAVAEPSEWDVADELLKRVYPGWSHVPNAGILRGAIADLICHERGKAVARVAVLTAELKLWKSLTPEEAEAARDRLTAELAAGRERVWALEKGLREAMKAAHEHNWRVYAPGQAGIKLVCLHDRLALLLRPGAGGEGT